ncbi:conserved hypothetical protein [Histoplasma capsulatum G186AR]|uniref:RING-type domain-containing protein n=2 Tax=Ajellomyces capsulatus TaxID=5037 RepID=C0NA46_AJECG|nr:uncharacterized protein HCBG_01205 [Histoplasma capsulatum G186AR]EEH11750.1 conserved hypothetical protein [Histoplasma capsulatum G186AR]KAG5302389.1 hypothetical protein I7I52_00017 [Histoplasma capsulatum]QSS72212.1 hypothetical protein I7I50_03314 [Histoplasma capsulatum G186AR]
MATLDLASGLMEIANSLAQDEIPFKLRCAICNKLAINAFRLPCCDQAICENCQGSLPECCPVCAHTPLSSDLCKPNKALRTTLRAFLRTEEKKREKDRPPAPLPVTEPEPNEPVDHVNSNSFPPPSTALDHVGDASEPNGASVADDANNPNHSAATMEAMDNISTSTLPTATPDDAINNSRDIQVEAVPGNSTLGTAKSLFNDNANLVPPGASAPWQPDADSSNGTGDLTSGQLLGVSTLSRGSDAYVNGQGYGMNGMGGLSQTSWQGSSNYGQIMQTLPGGVQLNGVMPFQNGIGPPGMAGMGLDPMASSHGMFGGYGVNINGMNDGMNTGMNFNAGQGMYGAWDGQSNVWNGGPDKFNANPFANRMVAEFGPSPGGYRGYNMSQNYANYPHMHQQQQYPNNDFHSQFGLSYGRGRGRGRGFLSNGRGRGGFMSAAHGSYPLSTNQASSFQPHMTSHSLHQLDLVSPAITPDLDHVKKFNDDLCPGGEDELKQNQATDEHAAVSPKNAATNESVLAAVEPHDSNAPTYNELPVNRATESGTTVQVGAVTQRGTNDNSDPGSGQTSGVYINVSEGNRNNALIHSNERVHPSPTLLPTSHNNTTSTEPRGMGVVGAPAAPRAMREGLANVTIRNGRGFSGRQTASSPTLKRDKEVKSRSPSPPLEQPASRYMSISRSPSRHPPRHHRRHRHQSPSPSVSGSDQGREENRKQRRKSRRENDDQGSSRRANKDSRSRSVSSDRRKRVEHRSRRGMERKNEHKPSSSHRSLRHRSRSSSPKHREYDRNTSEVSVFDTSVKLSSLGEKRDLVVPGSEHRSTKERANGSTTGDKSSRHRDRNRDRDRDRDRDRERDRDRNKIKDKDKERARGRGPNREREKDRDRDHERDRKRSRRDRSESPEDPDHYRRHSRRVKRCEPEEISAMDREKKSAEHREPRVQVKDPHTLEREARDKERLLKEQQRRDAMNADRHGRNSRHRESRQGRTLGGRHLSYKYEDEESDQARATRVELEREAARWA